MMSDDRHCRKFLNLLIDLPKQLLLQYVLLLNQTSTCFSLAQLDFLA